MAYCILSQQNQCQEICIFVQSIESRFYPEDEVTLRTLVDLTYSLHVNFITEATWIKEYLKEHFDQDALLVRNGISKAYFNDEIKPKVPRASEKLRVLVEGPLNVSFKIRNLQLSCAGSLVLMKSGLSHRLKLVLTRTLIVCLAVCQFLRSVVFTPLAMFWLNFPPLKECLAPVGDLSYWWHLHQL